MSAPQNIAVPAEQVAAVLDMQSLVAFEQLLGGLSASDNAARAQYHTREGHYGVREALCRCLAAGTVGEELAACVPERWRRTSAQKEEL